MEEIYTHLNQHFTAYTSIDRIHQNQNELVLNTNYHGNKTTIKFWRENHNPMQLHIGVEFNNRLYAQEAWDQQNAAVGWFKSAGKMIFTVLAVIIVLIIFTSVISIASLFNPLYLIIIMMVIFAALYYQINQTNSPRKRGPKEAELNFLLQQVKTVVSGLQDSVYTETKKCWNCFEEVDITDNVCGYCGKSQR